MNIDRIIENVAEQAKRGAQGAENADNFRQDQNLECISLSDLCMSEILSDDIKTEIYKRMKKDAEIYINDWMDSPCCFDTNKDKGMYKCSHETYQACIREFGIDYYKKYKYLHDIRRERVEGGARLKDELLYIGIEVYESICDEYRKVFQIVDCCAFLGVSKDYMYQLNEMHALFLKKAHTATENSLRIGALTGRGNVTGHAIILNHDYDYTRTTQVIHTNQQQAISAEKLPTLESKTQDIVLPDIPANFENL